MTVRDCCNKIIKVQEWSEKEREGGGGKTCHEVPLHVVIVSLLSTLDLEKFMEEVNESP